MRRATRPRALGSSRGLRMGAFVKLSIWAFGAMSPKPSGRRPWRARRPQRSAGAFSAGRTFHTGRRGRAYPPSWISADQANLDALARARPDNPREAFRAWTTARWLVRIGQDLGRRRFGTPLARGVAFLIDLVLVTAPAAVIWVYLALTIPGTVVDVLSNTVFGAVALGFAAWAFLYFVVAEGWFGTTVGKSLVHLTVRNRALGEPSITAVMVRDAPKLLPLSIIGVGGAIGVILLFRGADVSVSVGGQGVVLAGDPFAFLTVLGFIVITVGLCGLVSWILMVVSNESQRFGDLLAGTWVVREATPAPLGAPAPPPVPAAEKDPSG